MANLLGQNESISIASISYVSLSTSTSVEIGFNVKEDPAYIVLKGASSNGFVTIKGGDSDYSVGSLSSIAVNSGDYVLVAIDSVRFKNLKGNGKIKLESTVANICAGVISKRVGSGKVWTGTTFLTQSSPALAD